MANKAKEHFKDHPNHVGCDFGWKKEHFNLTKKDIRDMTDEARATLNKPSKGKHTSGTSGTSGGGSGTVTFLLDFTGYTVSGTSWNYTGDIVCTPANLLPEQVDAIMANIMTEYAPYKVVVTVDEAVYNAAPADRRMRCVFTESWEWYGQAGGVAFVGSLGWTDNTPCFVFTSLLNYNTKYIKEAAAHELGHTCGLYHHAKYDPNCVMVSQYDYGDGVTAPIMGVGYYVPDAGTIFNEGPTPYGCTSLQNDPAILTTKLGLR